MGDVVCKRSLTGKTIMTKLPAMSKVKWSPAQIAQRERLIEANAYTKAAMADPGVRAIYEKMAKKKKRQPFRVAISDYCKGNNLLVKK